MGAHVPLLQVSSLTVRFGGVTALDHVTLDVEEGSFVGLIGPNGAGKTTMVDALTNLVSSRGRICLDGEDITSLKAHRRAKRGLVRTFQSLELFPEFTVRENLLVAAESLLSPARAVRWGQRRQERAQVEQRVDGALEVLGLLNDKNTFVADLSLGQRKLVTIARALSARPRLLLLDEPAAGLDSRQSLALGQRLSELSRSGITIVMIDHDMALVLSVCDRVHVLEFGKLIASGSPVEIRRNPKVIAAYLGPDAQDNARTEASA